MISPIDPHIDAQKIAAIITARDAKNLAAIAEVYVAAFAVRAFAAINRGIERDAIADGETVHRRTNGGNYPGCFVAHDDGRNAAAGRAVITVNVTAADAARRDADEHFVRRRRRRGKIGEFEILVAGKEKCFHVCVVSFQTSRFRSR